MIRPFGRWSHDHLVRVNHSHDELQSQVKIYDRQVAECKKLRSSYYNKCRLVEDLEEESGLAFPAPATAEDKGKGKEVEKEAETTPSSPVSRKSTVDESDEWPLEVGDAFYTKEQLSELLTTMTREIPQKDVKVGSPLPEPLTLGPNSRSLQELFFRSRNSELVDCNYGTYDSPVRRENWPGSYRSRISSTHRSGGKNLCQFLTIQLPMDQEIFRSC